MNPEDNEPDKPTEDAADAPGLTIVKNIDVPGYSGPDRRQRQRRVGALDRRELLRFEPDKAPRRSGQDRRGPKSIWDGRNEA